MRDMEASSGICTQDDAGVEVAVLGDCALLSCDEFEMFTLTDRKILHTWN